MTLSLTVVSGHELGVQQSGDPIESIYDVDPVATLIDQYLDNSTLDLSIPLTSEEISGRSQFILLSLHMIPITYIY